MKLTELVKHLPQIPEMWGSGLNIRYVIGDDRDIQLSLTDSGDYISIEEVRTFLEELLEFIKPLENEMPGPSLKLYFENEDEHQIVQREAALMGVTAKQLVLQCTRKVLNDIFAERQARYEEEMAKQKAEDITAEDAAEDDTANAVTSGDTDESEA